MMSRVACRPPLRAILILLSWLAWPVLAIAATDTSANEDIGPTVVHLLDYVGVDYPPTVRDGKIADAPEYQEQQEFVAEAARLILQLPGTPQRAELVAKVERLRSLVDAKAAGNAVSAVADELRWDVVRAYGIEVAPKQAPPMAKVTNLFQAQCAACHGSRGRGDGPLSKTMETPPANFHDAGHMRLRSVYGLYNTLTLGVAGTPMRPFKELPEQDRWALALLVSSLRFTPEQLRAGQSMWAGATERAGTSTLRDLVTRSPAEVMAKYGPSAEFLLGYLDTHPDALNAATPDPLVFSRAKLQEALQRYRQGDREAARQLAVTAYLEGFELVENSLDAVDSGLRANVEREMMALRGAIGAGQPVEAVTTQVSRIDELLRQAQDELSSDGLSPGAAFASSLLILLREGLEAVLVLAAIIAFVRKTGRRDALLYVHLGWVGALAAGVITWWVARSLLSISGANREVTEGITGLIASAMLLYVGYWLHSKSYAQAWQRFIRKQVNAALGKGTLWAMATVSFLAVYRELFEIILFYEALWVQAGEHGQTSVVAGMAAAAVALALLTWLILRYSVRLPIGPFFAATSTLLALLAIVFAGSGVAALQEAGVISVHPVAFVSIPLLGVHPTLQSLLAQLLVLALAVGGALSARRRLAAH